MNKVLHALLAAAVFCGAVAYATPSRAAGQYPIAIETKGEAAVITAWAPEDMTIRMTVSVPKNSTKDYALANANYYEFSITVCGKTHKSRWNRGGTGVTLIVSGCDGYSFVMKR
jgi:hypothetical protein